MHFKEMENKFVANCFINKAAGLSRKNFQDRLKHIKHIRTRRFKAFSLVPKTEEDWIRIERFYLIINNGDFGQEANFPYDSPFSRIFGIYTPAYLFQWFSNNSLATIQKQILLYIASLSHSLHSNISKEILFGLVRKEVEELIDKYYANKDLWNADKLEKAYNSAAHDYYNSYIPESLSIKNAADRYLKSEIHPDDVFTRDDIFIRTAYFSNYDWDLHVLHSVSEFVYWRDFNDKRGPKPKIDPDRKLIKIPSLHVEKICNDNLDRAESDKDSWSRWLTTFKRFPLTKSHVFALYDKEVSGYIYIIKSGLTNKYKIGWTTKSNVSTRKSQLQVATPEQLEEIHHFPVASKKAEKTIHDIFKHKRRSGEWFELIEEDLNNLCSSEWRKKQNIF